MHAFFSNGLIGFARTYLESFRLHHGDEIPVVFDTRDLADGEIAELHALYPNLQVRNARLDLARLAETAEVDLATLESWKHEVEHDVTTDQNFRWKLLMSVEERYRSLPEVARELRAAGHEKLVHTDIDSYFRGGLHGLFDMLDDYDVVAPIRKKKLFSGVRKKGRIWGCLIGIALNDRSEWFLDEWHRRIEDLPFPSKPRGYGQLSLYDAYRACGRRVRWGNLYADRRAPTLCKVSDDNERDPEVQAATIWAGNSNAGRNRKDLSSRRFRADMRQSGSAPAVRG